jgi:hypothetical protein
MQAPGSTPLKQQSAVVSQTVRLRREAHCKLNGENGDEDEKWNAAWIALFGGSAGLRGYL